MGTRCAIGIMHNDRIIGKYSHYDGYPSYTGEMLKKHYSNPIKTLPMIALGDQSVLMKEFMPTSKNHCFETPDEDVTVFYGRDRGESGVDAKWFDSYLEFVDHYAEAGCEYFYLWAFDRGTKEYRWMCWDTQLNLINLYKVKEAA